MTTLGMRYTKAGYCPCGQCAGCERRARRKARWHKVDKFLECTRKNSLKQSAARRASRIKNTEPIVRHFVKAEKSKEPMKQYDWDRTSAQENWKDI